MNTEKQRKKRYPASIPSELGRPHDGALPFCRRVGRAFLAVFSWMCIVTPARATESVVTPLPSQPVTTVVAPPTPSAVHSSPIQSSSGRQMAAASSRVSTGAWRGTTYTSQVGARPMVARYVPRHSPNYPSAQPPGSLSLAEAPGPDAVRPPPEPPYFDIAVATQFPLSIGGQATLELPARLLLQVDVGAMPTRYGSAIGAMFAEFAGTNNDVLELANGALDQALVVRLSGGWRPFASAGFEMWFGYTSASLSGGVTLTEVAAVVDNPLTTELVSQLPEERLSLDSQLHNFHVALGWRWVAFEHLVIRANIGYTQTVSSSSSVEIAGRPDVTALANSVIDEELNSLYRAYVKLPSLGLSAGYRF